MKLRERCVSRSALKYYIQTKIMKEDILLHISHNAKKKAKQPRKLLLSLAIKKFFDLFKNSFATYIFI